MGSSKRGDKMSLSDPLQSLLATELGLSGCHTSSETGLSCSASFLLHTNQQNEMDLTETENRRRVNNVMNIQYTILQSKTECFKHILCPMREYYSNC